MEDDGPVEEEFPSWTCRQYSGKRDSGNKADNCEGNYNFRWKGSDEIGTDTKRATKLQRSVYIWAW